MKQKLPCEIVRDLLPSYVDGLTGKMTNTVLQEHLDSCPACAEALRRMKEPDAPPQERQVDFLKKIRRRSGRTALLCSVAAVAVVAVLLFLRFFAIGNPTESALLYCQAQVDGQTLTVTGSLTTRDYIRSQIEEQDGVVTIQVFSSPDSPWSQKDFQVEYTADAPIQQVYLEDRLLWQEGVTIRTATAEIFATVHPYVGDMPANSVTLAALGVYEQFGPFQNELHTAEEPYTWTLTLDKAIDSTQEATARDIMQADASVLLAAVGNLSTVTWEYETPLGSRQLTVTAEDASTTAGRDIKECGADAIAMQELLQGLSFQWTGAQSSIQDGDASQQSFTIRIRQNSTANLTALYMDYTLNGTGSGQLGIANADGSPLSSGDILDFQFTQENFSTSVDGVDLTGFCFDLVAITADGPEISVCQGQPLSALYGREYVYTLQGDLTTGLTLTATAE